MQQKDRRPWVQILTLPLPSQAAWSQIHLQSPHKLCLPPKCAESVSPSAVSGTQGERAARAGASAQPHQLPLPSQIPCGVCSQADAHPCPLTPQKAPHLLEPSWRPRQRDGMFGDERASSVAQLYHPSSGTITPLLAP